MEPQVIELIKLALQEDIGHGDITTQAIYAGNESASADFIAKQEGIIAGLDVARFIFAEVDPSIELRLNLADGDKVCVGDPIARVIGPAGSLLTAERTVLNFLQRMSGVATRTHTFVQAVAGTKAQILDTRKTIPGHRYTDKWAVRIGGGMNHRIGLYDRYLIKENHIAVAGGVSKAIQACVQHRASTSSASAHQIEIEINTLEQLQEALKFPEVDYIMLDNMSRDTMREAVAITNNRCKLEASGNVNMHTVSRIAHTGVDFISIGAITHSVEALDISLMFR
jgi:nicotinate-nucleotide pyrophosphorylase (carboxylating)